jgi:hypothetical protein
MNIVAFIYSPTDKEKELASNIFNLYNIECNILGFPQYSIEKKLKEVDVCIIFGDTLKTFTTDILDNIKLIELPQISKLTKKEENKEFRLEVKNKLTELQKFINDKEDIILVNKKDIPSKVNKPKKETQSSFSFMKDNTEVIVTKNKTNKENSLEITQEELYILSNIIKVFNVEEIKIERK